MKNGRRTDEFVCRCCLLRRRFLQLFMTYIFHESAFGVVAAAVECFACVCAPRCGLHYEPAAAARGYVWCWRAGRCSESVRFSVSVHHYAHHRRLLCTLIPLVYGIYRPARQPGYVPLCCILFLCAACLCFMLFTCFSLTSLLAFMYFDSLLYKFAISSLPRELPFERRHISDIRMGRSFRFLTYVSAVFIVIFFSVHRCEKTITEYTGISSRIYCLRYLMWLRFCAIGL